MLNHFRTLLLNSTYDGTDPHVPNDFVSKPLTPVLSKLWTILFSSNNYRNGALVHAYLNLVISSGLEEELTRYDQRTSYDPKKPSYFDFNQITTTSYSDSNFPLFVTGEYSNLYLDNSTGDTFVVTQVGTSNVIRVLSRATGKYVNNSGFFNDPEDAEIELTFTSNLSQPIQLYQTGLTFVINKNASTSFDAVSGKIWSYSTTGPLELDIKNRIDTFINAETFELFSFLDNPTSLLLVNDAREEKISTKKFALLLSAFVATINDL